MVQAVQVLHVCLRSSYLYTTCTYTLSLSRLLLAELFFVVSPCDNLVSAWMMKRPLFDAKLFLSGKERSVRGCPNFCQLKKVQNQKDREEPLPQCSINMKVWKIVTLQLIIETIPIKCSLFLFFLGHWNVLILTGTFFNPTRKFMGPLKVANVVPQALSLFLSLPYYLSLSLIPLLLKRDERASYANWGWRK